MKFFRCVFHLAAGSAGVLVCSGGAFAQENQSFAYRNRYVDAPQSPRYAKSDEQPPARARSPGVFFPPSPPIYGAPLSNMASIAVGVKGPVEPPDGLGNHVNEYFYPALSTRLLNGDFGKALAARVEAYLANRATLRNELLDALVFVEGADPATRERELQSFAAVQTPRIVAHEAEGERLRRDLIDRGALDMTVDWSRDRKWKLGDGRLSSPSVAKGEFQVIRAAAYYQAGLLPEQRGLLCEMAEQRNPRPSRSSWGNSPATPEPAAFFFSPETARFRIPSLPAELATRLAAYKGAKDALKAELLETLENHDKSPEAVRTSAFEKLADQQWPRLRDLENLAEEIRRDLMKLPPPPVPALPPQIPPDLLARIASCQTERNALIQERAARINAIAPPLPVTPPSRNPSEFLAGLRARMREREQAMNEEEDRFRHENADRYSALETNLSAIEADLREFLRAHVDPATGAPMDLRAFVKRFRTTDQYFEQIAREEVLYKNYKIAMLEPGLSPEQRRLLFGAAYVGLSQALPAAELFPFGQNPR